MTGDSIAEGALGLKGGGWAILESPFKMQVCLCQRLYFQVTKMAHCIIKTMGCWKKKKEKKRSGSEKEKSVCRGGGEEGSSPKQDRLFRRVVVRVDS